MGANHCNVCKRLRSWRTVKAHKFLRIVIPSPLWQLFDYLPLETTDFSKLQPGVRIKVPFGRRELIGILLTVSNQTEFPISRLKSIIEIIDEDPLLPQNLLKLYQWASDYYHYPLGEVIFGTLPKNLRKPIRKKITKPISSPVDESVVSTSLPFSLNNDQQIAVDAITDTHNFKTFLLAGITGSGKTEVYLQCIANLLQQGKQALVLVPEIGLTPQTVSRFKSRFKVPVAVLHSALGDKKRAETWLQAKNGEAAIIIGTRSAIFTPLQNPGIIILDEEHDLSFKQQSGFRYSARDLAIVRGRLENIPVVLGSATPSLESLYNAKRGRYQQLELAVRAGDAQLPEIKLLDLRGQKLQGGLSPLLLTTLREQLNQGRQVLLFLNRRGFAPVLMCHSCGWLAHCQHCSARLTIHRKPPRLQCHHCGASQKPPKICENCHQSELIPLGQGTERLEEVLQAEFPNFPILRIDRDNVRGKGQMDKLLEQMYSQEASILVGTQMLAKGHHLPNLSLVAIVDMDGGLFSTDFRATERMSQLLIQVAGRAGREKITGQVYIQTHHPDHPLLKLLLEQHYFSLTDKLLAERKSAQLPPYAHLALLRVEASNLKENFAYLEEAKHFANRLNVKEVVLWGPVPAPMERKAGRYRAQLLFQTNSRQALQRLLLPLSRELNQFKLSNKVRWSLDIDPQDMS